MPASNAAIVAIDTCIGVFDYRASDGQRTYSLADFIPTETQKRVRKMLANLSDAWSLDQISGTMGQISKLLEVDMAAAFQLVSNSHTDLPMIARTLLSSEASELTERLRFLTSISRVQLAADQAEASAKHVREVAGEEAQGELAQHFKYYGDRQRRIADSLRLRVISITVVSASVLAALIGVHGGPSNWLELVRKLALIIPGAALAGYMARESSRHREHAEWAESIEVQLRTINAFTDALDEPLKSEIRSDFGKRVFSETGRSIPKVNQSDSALNMTFQPLVRDLITLIKEINSGAKK